MLKKNIKQNRNKTETEQMAVPIDLDISPEYLKYETDEEYQRLFGRIFHIDETAMNEITDMFDDERVMKGMDYIFAQTQQDVWWNALYIKSAAVFMTEDPNIGLCTLLTFSFLKEFYLLFRYYMTHPKDDPEIPVLQKSFMEFFDAENA
jgi:hypothetical protein